MKLSKRLEGILDAASCWVSGQRKEDQEKICVADVGTDHGFVPICLVERGIVDRALALDARKGPLLRAQEHVQERGLQDRVELRLGDGLAPLKPGEAQLVILTGMGGELMLRILQEGQQVRERVRGWILSPQSEPALFRHGLEELGLAICEEEMIKEEGKYYTIITAEPGEMHYSGEYQYRYGGILIQKRSLVLQEYLEQEIRLLEGIRRRLLENPKKRNPGVEKRLKEVEKELEEARQARALM